MTPDQLLPLVYDELSKLAELERWLWQGPPRARVEQVVFAEVEFKSFRDFSVRQAAGES